MAPKEESNFRSQQLAYVQNRLVNRDFISFLEGAHPALVTSSRWSIKAWESETVVANHKIMPSGTVLSGFDCARENLAKFAGREVHGNEIIGKDLFSERILNN